MDACTKRNTMIYTHKNYKLEINNARGKFYINDRLVFQGFAFKAIKIFIDNCNDAKVRKHFKTQLTMREKNRFNREEKNVKEKAK